MPLPRRTLLAEPSLGPAPPVVRLAHRGNVLVNGAITVNGPGRKLLARPETMAVYLEGGH